MGILDELKQQAASMRAAEAEEAQRKAAQQAFYEQSLQPVMLQVLSYLDELVKQINYVQPERHIAYPLAPDRQSKIELVQSAYKLVIDSSANPRQLDVRLSAKLTESVEYDIRDRAAIDSYCTYLNSYNFKYHRRDQLNSRHRLQSALFTLEGPLQLAMRVQADSEQQCIVVLLKNFSAPGVQRYRYQPGQVDDALLDRMGRLILHEVDTLNAPVEVPTEVREKLRQQLLQKQREETQLELDNSEEGAKLWQRSASRLRQISRANDDER
ncbi:hypothetical protein [Gilvimarinus sp. DA14]|uniref:hypothetical protein n=1 Tax=Gilvimarinus sp. DA14 TaxID=2956798 RepID=UPI0020B864FE|nr:hypothetical protein [Gilvimarinus sp. DA14]UTF59580.1 hypothetical protein NHM04_14015 [Gilvimarinus sp. DA14]